MLTYGRAEHKYLSNTKQEMSSYGRSEHECLPNIEQYILINDSSGNVFLLRPWQNLLISGGL